VSRLARINTGLPTLMALFDHFIYNGLNAMESLGFFDQA
jgi:hypothetical protein